MSLRILPGRSSHVKNLLSVEQPAVGDVIVKDYMDCQYFIDIGVGKGGKFDTFTVIPDTGSSNLWVPSSTCDSPACTSHSTFDEKQYFENNPHHEGNLESLQCYDTGKSFAIQYGSGECAGKIGVADVEFAGYEIPKNAVGLTTEEPGSTFVNADFDGIMGMAWHSISVWNQEKFAADVHSKPVFNSLIESENWDASKQLFAFYLGSDGADGHLLVGDTEIAGKKLYKGEINYVPLSSQTYWQFKAEHMTVGNQKMEGLNMIADSGTSLIAGPSEAVAKINTEIFGTPYVDTVDCSMRQTGPTVDISINGKAYSLEATDYVMEFSDGFNSQCISSFTGLDIGTQNLWILGDVFMRKYFTVFDVANSRLGFAEAV
eukprot:CAMPEP_0184481498 /NCGR_PEP_ID=MMETSP0113_2-20130426/3034_1 /TAXON_ID=91329 /ORGANISM="Norrisiella sphaerica, Strain BC52" /LENGTH=373 /DNA_ID=CAMNT_0026860655 /DNA_START=348 /DNA_END=1469 /DNA_ORIENTATION=-